jgi:hypothetical protein
MAKIQELPLNFANLATIDSGKVDKLLRFHLQRIAADLQARAGTRNPRKLVLEFSFVPISDEIGDCEGCKVEIEAKSKIPVYRTKTYEMRVVNNGMLFNQDFPDSKDQPSLLPNEDEERAKDGSN